MGDSLEEVMEGVEMEVDVMVVAVEVEDAMGVAVVVVMVGVVAAVEGVEVVVAEQLMIFID